MGERAALYLRTDDGTTTTDQRRQLEQRAISIGFAIVAVYEEPHGSNGRPEYARMIRDAHRGSFDVVLVWSLHRPTDALKICAANVDVVSVCEGWLDTRGATRRLLLDVLAWSVERESHHFAQRTREGVRRARLAGKRVGRPPKALDLDRAYALLAKGLSKRAVARSLHVGATTLRRALTRAPKRVQ